MMVLATLALAIGPAKTPPVPCYAHVLGITAGDSTVWRLDKLLPGGIVGMGTDPDGARYWKFKSASISIDSNGGIVTHLYLYRWKGRLRSCYPFSRFKEGCLGRLVYGEPARQAEKQLADTRLFKTSLGYDDFDIWAWLRRDVKRGGQVDRYLYRLNRSFCHGKLYEVDLAADNSSVE